MSAIEQKYKELGGSGGFLGKPSTKELVCPDGVGRYNHYQGGSIYWHPDLGAFEVHGAILTKWSELGWEKSHLGYPKTDEHKTPDGVGRYNHFQGGSIYWHPNLGAFEVHGAIRAKWSELGWEKSYLGYPKTDECITPDKVGRYSHFDGGSIYWTPKTGAFSVHKQIREEWARRGWEAGDLGYPIADTRGTTDSTLKSAFQNGSISWSKTSGYKVSSEEIKSPKTQKEEKNLPGRLVAKPFINMHVKNLPNVPSATSNTTCIGYGYNALNGDYISEEYVKWSYPILKLEESDIKAMEGFSNHSNISIETESTVRDVMKQTSIKMGGGGRFLLFGGSIKKSFKKEEKTSDEFAYTKVMGVHRKERLSFKYSANYAKEYLDRTFKKDLNGNMEAKDLFNKYGTHVLLDVYIGGRIDASFSTKRKTTETLSEIKDNIKTSFSAVIFKAESEFSHEESKNVKEAWENSDVFIRTWGGDSYAGISEADFKEYNPKWVDSINNINKRGNWTICDIPSDPMTVRGFNESLVPIWEFAEDSGRKDYLSDEFGRLSKTIENGLLQNELYVVDMCIVADDNRGKAQEKVPQGYFLIDKDLNEGAGGKFIYLTYKLGRINQKPYTNLCIEILGESREKGYHNCTHNNIKSEYYRFGIDLNWLAKGKYIYLNGTKDSRFGPIRRLEVLSGDNKMPTTYSDDYQDVWNAVRERGTDNMADCNRGAKGRWIYILFKR